MLESVGSAPFLVSKARNRSPSGWGFLDSCVDYYASRRMTNDRHIRVREDGSEERLPTVSTMRVVSQDPDEDRRLAAEHLEENRRTAKMLEEKGFGLMGDEPGGVQIYRFLALGGEDNE